MISRLLLSFSLSLVYSVDINDDAADLMDGESIACVAVVVEDEDNDEDKADDDDDNSDADGEAINDDDNDMEEDDSVKFENKLLL